MGYTKNPKATPATIRDVLRTAGRPLSNREVAEALGVHPTTTLYWMHGLGQAPDILTAFAPGGRGRRTKVYSIKAGR